MRLLETNGIDLQLPNEEPTKEVIEIDLTHKIEPLVYDKEMLEELIGDYLQYYIYELRDQKTCDHLYTQIKWFLDKYYSGHNVLQIFLTEPANTIIVRIELWRDKESFEYYLEHFMDKERPEIYSVIGFFLENTHSVMPFNKNGYYPNGSLAAQAAKPAVKGLTIG